MKILYILDLYPVLSETFIRDEIEELQEQGHEVIITTFNKGEGIENLPKNLRPKIILNESPFSPLKAGLLLSRKIFNSNFSFEQKNIPIKEILFHSLKISAIAKEHNVEHIHSHFGLNAAAFAIQAAKFSKLTSSFTVHGYDVNKVNKDMYAKLKYVSKVISVSDFLKEELIKKNKGLKHYENKIKVIPFGVKNAKGLERNEIINDKYLFVGRFNKVKGIEHLLNIWKKDKTLSRLDLIGFGSEKEESFINEQIKSNQLNIRVLGKKNSAEIYQEMSKYKALILPFQENKITGEKDTGAIVVKEGMLNKIPIITTDLISHIISHKEAYIAKTEITESLYEKILEFESASEREIEQKVDLANKKMLKEFSIEKQVKEFIECIR